MGWAWRKSYCDLSFVSNFKCVLEHGATWFFVNVIFHKWSMELTSKRGLVPEPSEAYTGQRLPAVFDHDELQIPIFTSPLLEFDAPGRVVVFAFF
jgi:hypothetical protein